MRRTTPLLALSFLWAACATAEVRAREAWARLQVGMTREEVAGCIGGPDRTTRMPPQPGTVEQTVEVWGYEYSAPSAGEIMGAIAMLPVAAAFVMVAAKAGRIPDLPGGGAPGEPRFRAYRFWLGFGPDGRLRGVTSVEGVK